MKKISIIIILMSVLFLGITNVKADSEGKIYGILIHGNNIKEGKNIYKEDEEYKAANGKIKIKGSNIAISNLSNTDYISIENYSGELGMTLNITLSGNSTIKGFKWSGFSGKINISGTGSLKFKPVSTIGTKEIPALETGGIPFYYVEDVEKQKSEVSKIIKTSLPVTYVDGYVCINCKAKRPKKETSINTKAPKKEKTTAPVTPTKPTTSNNETKPNIEKKFVKKLISNEEIEFTSKDDIDSTYKLVTKDVTSNYSNMKLEKNLELIQVYDITVQSNDNKIVEMKNGEYLIKFKLSEKMKEYDNISVAYLKDGEIKEIFDTSKDDEYIAFTTTHLSEYAIMGNREEIQEESNVVKETKEDTKKQKSNPGFIIGGIVIIIPIIAAILFAYFKKKSK